VADVRLSALARADLEDIRDHGMTHFGEAATERHRAALQQAFALLAEHPLAGQARPEFRQDIRAIPRRPHRILYTVDEHGVLILRIIHQARDVRRALEGEA